jgi:hypothetical protein
MNVKQTLVVSFSGGKTSAYMCQWLIIEYGHLYNFVFIFANTGQECEETLIFVDQCDKAFGLNVVWVEAVVNPQHGKGITHKIVSFETASRNGEPFEAHIAKSGIPNANKPQCSDRLKKLVIEHYKKTHGLNGKLHAIGMREDEPNRVLSAPKRKSLRKDLALSAEQIEEIACAVDDQKKHLLRSLSPSITELEISKYQSGYNLWYPMYMSGTDKQDVNDFWEGQSFTLEIEEHQGNCKTCWKKSDKKLWLLAIEEPEKFDFMRRMENEYQHVKPNDNGDARVFFRGNRSVSQLIRESEEFDARTLRNLIGYSPDEDSGCSESCEAYGAL